MSNIDLYEPDDRHSISDADKRGSPELPSEIRERPDWDTFFMTLTFIIAQRSLDKHTKCGCVVVDDSNTILSTGYNSLPRGCIDHEAPLERPYKYRVMEHSESNAIVNAARIGIPLKDSIFYVTGPPCNDCFRKILNVGANRIIHGPILHQRDEDEIRSIEFMNTKPRRDILSPREERIDVVQFSNMPRVFDLLSQTGKYVSFKLGVNCEEKA
jgi:dCMP deaminase